MKTETLFSSDKSDWETPQELFDLLNSEFKFTIDLAANADNHKCERWLGPGSTINEDALSTLWIPELIGSIRGYREVCWLNPPYGRGIGAWMENAFLSAIHTYCTVVCLVPARTDTKWWWSFVRHAEVRFLRGRLKFSGADNSAPFPSAIVVFRKGAVRPETIYWEIGKF